MNSFSDRIEDLSPQERRQLLAKLLERKAARSEQVFPLSFAQRALWFLYKLDPASAAYNAVLAVRIRSELDVPALGRVVQALIDRHASLRTTYLEDDGEPRQTVRTFVPAPFRTMDARAWSPQELHERLLNETRRPFDLEQGPVLRADLFVRDARDNVLLLTVHHIAGDFWSLQLAMRELGTLYLADTTRSEFPPPAADAQFVDYVKWEQEMLSGPPGRRSWEYWRDVLRDGLPTLNLPTDRPRPVRETPVGAFHSFRIDAATTRQLRELAQQHGATLYMVLLAVFQALLHGWTGQRVTPVGSPAACRTDARFQHVIGCFVNMIVLSSDFSGNPRFDELLDRVRQSVLGALAHQNYPFPLLVQRIDPARDPTRPSLLRAVFQLERLHRFGGSEFTPYEREGGEAPTGAGEPRATFLDMPLQGSLGGLELEYVDLEQQLARFDLTLRIFDAGESLFGSLDYKQDLFYPAAVERLADHFRTLVRAVLADPAQAVGALPLLPETERYQVPEECNAAEIETVLKPDANAREAVLPRQGQRAERRPPEDYVAPRTPTEEVLAAIWAEALGIERVGVYDNFFALGGHSLLMTQVVSRVCDRLQVELSLRQMFQEPLVASIAAIIDRARERSPASADLPSERGSP